MRRSSQTKNKKISTSSDRQKKKQQKNGLTKKDEKSSRTPKTRQVQISESTLPEISFSEEISKIMYTFGEIRNPREDTVRYMENYLKLKIVEIYSKTRDEITPLRDGIQIEIQDVMFLFRKEPKKIIRIEKFLKLKEYGNVKYNFSGHKRKRTNEPLFEDISDEEESNDNILDEHDMNKHIISDLITRDMTLEEISDFNKCKEVSFAANLEKFKEWIKFDFPLQEKALELLAYLAYEYVGLLTQTSLIVKKDMELKSNDLQFLKIGTTLGIITEEMKERLINFDEQNDDFIQPQTTSKKPLQPQHIIFK
eukprot:gene9672-1878_t